MCSSLHTFCTRISWPNCVGCNGALWSVRVKGNKRDKLKGTNGAKFEVFRWFLQIFAFVFSGKWSISKVQILAENCRKPQIFTEHHRKPQIFAETRSSHEVCPFQLCPREGALASRAAKVVRPTTTSILWVEWDHDIAFAVAIMSWSANGHPIYEVFWLLQLQHK